MAPNAEDLSREKCQYYESRRVKSPEEHYLSETGHIITFVFVEKLELSSTQTTRPGQSSLSRRTGLVLLRLTDEIRDKYQITFDGMYKKMNVEQKVDCLGEMVKILADDMLRDDCFSWGRLSTLVAFVLHVADNLTRKGLASSEEVIALARSLSYYIDSELGTRLKQLGGWESLETFFPPQQNYEGMVRNGLIGTIVGLGLISLAIPVVRHLVQ